MQQLNFKREVRALNYRELTITPNNIHVGTSNSKPQTLKAVTFTDVIVCTYNNTEIQFNPLQETIPLQVILHDGVLYSSTFEVLAVNPYMPDKVPEFTQTIPISNCVLYDKNTSYSFDHFIGIPLESVGPTTTITQLYTPPNIIYAGSNALPELIRQAQHLPDFSQDLRLKDLYGHTLNQSWTSQLHAKAAQKTIEEYIRTIARKQTHGILPDIDFIIDTKAYYNLLDIELNLDEVPTADLGFFFRRKVRGRLPPLILQYNAFYRYITLLDYAYLLSLQQTYSKGPSKYPFLNQNSTHVVNPTIPLYNQNQENKVIATL